MPVQKATANTYRKFHGAALTGIRHHARRVDAVKGPEFMIIGAIGREVQLAGIDTKIMLRAHKSAK